MALASHTPATWDNILSSTMHNYRKQFTDNIFNSRPLLNHLMSNGRVRKISGGVSIVEPLVYVDSSGTNGAKTYAEWDSLTVVGQNTLTAAQYPWRQLVATIAISGLEEAQNNGPEQAVSLVEAKIMQAEESLKNLLSDQFWSVGSGSVDAPAGFAATAWESIYNIVDDATTTGGIAGSGEAWWRSYAPAAVGAVDAAGLESAMSAAWNTTSDGGSDRTDAIFAAQGVYQFYESTLTPQVRYTDVTKANLGFLNLMFKTAPMFYDFDAVAGSMVGVNSKYLSLVVHKDRDFAQSPFSAGFAGNSGGTGTNGSATAAHAVDARIAYITTFGNLTCRNRRRHWKLHTISKAP